MQIGRRIRDRVPVNEFYEPRFNTIMNPVAASRLQPVREDSRKPEIYECCTTRCCTYKRAPWVSCSECCACGCQCCPCICEHKRSTYTDDGSPWPLYPYSPKTHEEVGAPGDEEEEALRQASQRTGTGVEDVSAEHENAASRTPPAAAPGDEDVSGEHEHAGTGTRTSLADPPGDDDVNWGGDEDVSSEHAHTRPPISIDPPSPRDISDISTNTQNDHGDSSDDDLDGDPLTDLDMIHLIAAGETWMP